MTDTEVEYEVMEKVGLLFKHYYPDIQPFLLDNDWPEITGPFVGMQVVKSEDIGTAELSRTEDNRNITTQTSYLTLEIITFRGISTATLIESPTSILKKISRVLEDPEVLYQFIHQFNFGVISKSSISKIDTVLDGIEKQRRSRMLLTISVEIEQESDLVQHYIETVNGTVTTQDSSGNVLSQSPFSAIYQEP